MTTRRINAIPFTGITQEQTDQIIENTADILTKQDTIVATTDLTMNDLSIGNDAILPENLVQHPLKIQQPFLTGADPQNNFGVGIMFRYPRGGGTTTIEDQASIDSYFKSDGNTATPYGGLRFTAIDGGGRRTLFDAYQTNPVNNGDSTMEIGLNSQGTLKARYITLNNTDLATTLATKQPLLTNTTNIVVKKATTQNIEINCDLDPAPAPLYIIHDNINANPTVRTSIFVRKERDNTPYMILCDLDTVSPGNATTLGTDYDFKITGDGDIECAGVSKAREHVNLQDGNSVRGYGMFHFTQTGTNYNMNLPQGKAIRWTNKHSDTSLYTIIGLDNQNIQVSQAGFYEVSFTIFCTSSVSRPNPAIGLFKNATTFTGIGAWSYIRNSDNHNESSWTASAGIVQMSANDYFTVVGAYTQTGNTGAVYLVNQTFTGVGQVRPYLLIKRIS